VKLINWVSVVLITRRTVCGDMDCRSDNLSISLMMTSAQVDKMLDSVTTNSPSQDYAHPAGQPYTDLYNYGILTLHNIGQNVAP